MAEDASKQREEKHFQIKHLLHNCHVMQPFWKRHRETGKLFQLEEMTLSSQRGLADAWLALAQKSGPKASIKETPQGKQPEYPLPPTHTRAPPGDSFSPLSSEVSRTFCLPGFSNHDYLQTLKDVWVGMIRQIG